MILYRKKQIHSKKKQTEFLQMKHKRFTEIKTPMNKLNKINRQSLTEDLGTSR